MRALKRVKNAPKELAKLKLILANRKGDLNEDIQKLVTGKLA